MDRKKIFLFDIDGTLAVDSTLYEGTRRLLELIDEIGGSCFYITNNSTKSRKDYVKKFEAWEIPAREEQFLTASYATVQYLHRHMPGQKLYVIGTPSFLEELRSSGICVTEDANERGIQGVLVGFDTSFTYDKARGACQLLFEDPEMPYLATNPDLRCPASFGFIPDCGSICGMIQAAVGREPVYIGKPNALMADLCLQSCNGEKRDALVVGDRLYTDIACGIEAGIETALVFTGEAKPEDLEGTRWKPDYVFENIQMLCEAVEKAWDK